MYQEAKFSRFMFHVKFSQSEEYLNEHELYEIMRSRDLYQSQYALRLNFKKMSRNISKDEKQTRYGFENSRKLFVRKMQERLVNADKMKNKVDMKVQGVNPSTDNKINKGQSHVQNMVIKHERAGIPSLPSVRNNIKTKGLYTEGIEEIPPLVNTSTKKSPQMRSTSALATVCTSEYGNKLGINSSGTVRPKTESVINKTMVVGKSVPQTFRKPVPIVAFNTESDIGMLPVKDDKQRDGAISSVAKSNKPSRAKPKNIRKGRTLKFSDEIAPNVTNIRGEDKAKAWAFKHCLVTEGPEDMVQEADLERLYIDRPSKWMANHYHAGGFVNKDKLEVTNGIIRGTDYLNKNPKKIGHAEFSLPDIHVAPKPMVTLEPGGTTPDGRLVLTKADYEDYLSGYRKARVVRLDRSKNKDKQLEKKIDTFRVEPSLCLRDETSLETALRSI